MERTLALVKPDGMKRSLAEECIRRFTQANLRVKRQKLVNFSRKKAAAFRKDIKEKHPCIWKSLLGYMTEGPMLALLLEGENAIALAREICGPTNPKEAPQGTIRGDFAQGDMHTLYAQGKVIKNIIHASGNVQEATQEIGLIFGKDHDKKTA